MIKEYKVSKHNSTVNGDRGSLYDWSKFCWDGSAVYIEHCSSPNCKHIHKWKAHIPYVDGEETCQYLHVPYDWENDCTVFRIYPNDNMWAGQVYRGKKVISQKAIKKDDGWYWQLELEV
jgi:hypothetical protein